MHVMYRTADWVSSVKCSWCQWYFH